MADYNAGRAYLSVSPDTSGFARKVKADLAGLKGIPVDVDRRGLEGLRAALKALPVVVLDADSTPADREVAALRDKMTALADKRIGIDISGDAARAEIAAIKGDLERIGAPTVALDADISAASAKAAELRATLAELKKAAARDTPQLDLDIRAAEAKRDKLRADLDVLGSRTVTPTVEAKTAQLEAQLGRVDAQLATLGAKKVSPQVRADIAAAQTELGAVDSHLTELQGRRADVGASADTAGALDALGTLEREIAHADGRRVTVNANVDTHDSGPRLLALAGGAVSATAAMLPLLRTTTLAAGGIGALVLGVGAAVNLLGTLGPVVYAAVGGLALLPAVGLAGAAVFGTMKIGLLHVGDALKYAFDPTKVKQFEKALAGLSPQARATVLAIQGMGPAFKALRMDVQDRLFAGMAGTLQGLAGTYLPMARAGFGAMASSINAGAQGFLGWLRVPQIVGMLAATTGNVTRGFDNLTKAILPGGQAITTLAAVGSTQLPGIGNVIASIAASFNDFIQGAASSGALQTFIASAVQQLGVMFQVIGNVGSIFISVFSAASTSGAVSLLTTLNNLTGALAVFLSSAPGISLLQSLFTSVSGALAGVMPLVVALGQTIAGVLLPVIISILPAVGAAFGALAPAIAPLGMMVAALAPLLVTLLQVLAPLIVALISGLAPIIAALAPLFGILAMALGSILIAAVQAIAPPLLLVAQILTATLGPILPVIAALFAQVAMTVGGVLLQVLSAVAPLFPMLAGAVVGLLVALLPLVPLVTNFATQVLAAFLPILPVIVTLFVALVNALLPIIPPVLTLAMTLLTLLMPVLQVVATMLGIFGGTVGVLAVGLATALVPVLGVLVGVLNWLMPVLAPLVYIILGIWGAMLLWSVAQTLLNIAMSMNPIVLVVLAILTLVGVVIWAYQNVGWFRAAVDACWAGIQIAFSAIAAAAVWLWQTIFVPAWTAIAGAVMWAWTTIIWPILQAIGTALAILGAVLFVVLVAPFVIAWNLISALVSWAWSAVLAPIWYGAMVPALQFLGAVFTWLYTNVVLPVWNAILAAINFVWLGLQVIWYGYMVPALQYLGAIFTWLYTNVVLPVWNAILAAVNFVWLGLQVIWYAYMVPALQFLGSIFSWLLNNVVAPVWNALGAIINFVWQSVIRPAFQAVVGGLDWLGMNFQRVVDWIGQIWNTIRGFLARPINFLIDVVWNKGIVPVWNKVAGLVGLGPIAPLGLIPEFAAGGRPRDLAAGGPISGPGTGTSDSILARVSNREFVVRETVASQTLPFLRALNAGDGEAIQAAGGGAARGVKMYRGDSGLGMNPMDGVPRIATGGLIDERIVAAKQWLSGPAQGARYVYGGGTNPRAGMDCSSMQAAVTHILSGRPPDSGRIGTTASMPWGGFVPGINGAYAIGNKPADHMAATLGGPGGAQNIEQHGPNGSPFRFPSPKGADNGYFPQKYHLGEAGGQFVSGGAGSGGGGFFDFISPIIRKAFELLTNPPIAALRALMGPPPPEYRAVPPGLATSARDKLLEFMLSKVPQGTGGAMGPPGDGAPFIVQQISDASRSRGFGREGAVIGTATGLVESNLRNLPGGDRDSVGVFQQRPSQGWGSVAECTNVLHAAGSFFARFPGNWRSMPPGDVAQGVQRSAFGGKYATRMGQASGLVAQFGGPFDAGGIARGSGLMWKGTGLDERVLPPQETQAYPTLTRLTQQIEAGRVPTAALAGASAQTRAAAMGASSGGFPTEFRLSSDSALRLDGDGLLRIVDGRLEAVGSALDNGRQV